MASCSLWSTAVTRAACRGGYMLAGASAIALLIARLAALCSNISVLWMPSELKKMSTMSCGDSADKTSTAGDVCSHRVTLEQVRNCQLWHNVSRDRSDWHKWNCCCDAPLKATHACNRTSSCAFCLGPCAWQATTQSTAPHVCMSTPSVAHCPSGKHLLPFVSCNLCL